MNILICDDDKHYVDTIRKYVDEFFDLNEKLNSSCGLSQ